MTLFRTPVFPALLILALAVISGSASAEREQGHRDWGREPAVRESHENGLQFRGQFRDSQIRDTQIRETQFRSDGRDIPRNDFRSRERFNERQRISDPRTDAVYQRLYDDRREDGDNYRSGYNRGGQRPVNDVVREVQDRYGGQVIGVQNSDGGSMYRVRVLQRDGRVKNVMVPAE